MDGRESDTFKFLAQARPKARWQLQTAKARFSELFGRARSEGPQLITRREAVMPLFAKEIWLPLTDRMNVAVEPFSAPTTSQGTNLHDPLAQWSIL